MTAPDSESPVLRRARIADRERLLLMQARSLRVLGRGDYSDAEIETFLRHSATMDDFLLHDGTYSLIEIDGCVAACGGWSRRGPHMSASHPPALDQAVVPWIRSVFVDPRYARRGLARRLMELAEREAALAGHRQFQLYATITGVPFYRSLGYAETGPADVALPDGLNFRLVAMRKMLEPKIGGAARAA
jgi:GNAT superfamily N-acetyltransferase